MYYLPVHYELLIYLFTSSWWDLRTKIPLLDSLLTLNDMKKYPGSMGNQKKN